MTTPVDSRLYDDPTTFLRLETDDVDSGVAAQFLQGAPDHMATNAALVRNTNASRRGFTEKVPSPKTVSTATILVGVLAVGLLLSFFQ